MAVGPSRMARLSSRDAAEAAGAGADAGIADHPTLCMCDACANAEGRRDDEGAAGHASDGAVGSAAPTATLQEMSDFLEVGYWRGAPGPRHNLGTTGRDANDGVLHYNLSGFGPLRYGSISDADGVSAARAELIRDAFDVYGAVLGIDFVETLSQDDDVVDFFFSDNWNGAFAGSTRYSDGTIHYSYINVAAGWSGGTSSYDDYTLQTVFHEIGHALGLGHQGFYNGSAGYANDASFALDSWQASMMSYFSQTANTAIDASWEMLQTPMAVDWLALDSIYGGDGYGVSNAFVGDTTYGFETTISAEESRIWNAFADYADRTASTIVDADGVDTLNVGGYAADQKIDLTIQTAGRTSQTASDIGGRIGNLTLAVGTVIENAVGGSGDDVLIGNRVDNVLTGGGGDDALFGGLGDDTVVGGAGFDTAVYASEFASYAFSVFQDAIEVVGDGIDLVLDTVEAFQFADLTYGYEYLADLFADTAPDAADDTARVAEGDALDFDVLANDGDADGDALGIVAVAGQDIEVGGSVVLDSGATVTLNDGGTLLYVQNGAFDALDDGQTAEDGFGYTVSDARGGVADASAIVTIDGSGEARETVWSRYYGALIDRLEATSSPVDSRSGGRDLVDASAYGEVTAQASPYAYGPAALDAGTTDRVIDMSRGSDDEFDFDAGLGVDGDHRDALRGRRDGDETWSAAFMRNAGEAPDAVARVAGTTPDILEPYGTAHEMAEFGF